MEANIEHHKRVIAQRAEALVADAKKLGLVVTVSQVSVPPLAMGRLATQVEVRPARVTK